MEKMAIRLWDVATGENIHTILGSYNGRGSHLISLRTEHFWRVEVLMALSCSGM